MRKIVEDARGAACREHSSVRVGNGAVFAAVLVIVLMLAYACAGSALAARGHEFTGSFGSPGSGAGQLGGPTDLAVNEATGDLYVLDKANNRVEIFNATGSKFEGEFNGSGLGLGILGSGLLLNEGKAAGSGGLAEEIPTGRFDEPEGIAIDNDPTSPSFGDVYVADSRGHKENDKERAPTEKERLEEDRMVVDKFSASGEYIGQITRNPNGEPFNESGFRFLYGVAVDSHGGVWVEEQNYGSSPTGAANYTNAVANAWIGFRPTPGVFVVEGKYIPFAVNSEDDLYANTLSGSQRREERLTEFNTSGEVIALEADEEEPTGAGVELSSNGVYVGHLTNVHRLDASGKSLETLTIPGGHGSGVAVNSTTLTVYAADSVAGVIDTFGPEAPGAPTVSAGSASIKDVTATSASFSAEVNPRSEPNEEVTSYRFVYGPCDTPTTCASSPYAQSTPEGRLAANYEPDLVSAQSQDLLAHTTYHMRLVAHNSHAGVAEGEELTFTTQATGAFILPDGRQWELVSPPNKYGALIEGDERLSQASSAGGAITYAASGPIEAQPPGNYNSNVQAVSVRTTTGWQSLNINAPHETAPSHDGRSEYPFFSTDLSLGILQPAGAFVPSISDEASEQTPFLRSDFAAANPAGFCTSSCYTPLVSGAPGFENVPAGTVFGSDDVLGGECVAAICGPLFLGASPDASHIILSYRWAPLVEGHAAGGLYEWSGGRLSVVGGGGVFGGGGEVNATVRNAVSTDGSRVVTSGGPHLYLSDVPKEETVQLDEVQGGSGAGAVGPPIFEDASSDGSRVFFTAPPYSGLSPAFSRKVWNTCLAWP